MTRLRVGIDGYNLAMPHGTGIATYARMLANTLRSMGHGVEGFFGLDVTGPADQRQTLFYDRLARPSLPAKVWHRRWREKMATLRLASGARADAVGSGVVDTRAFADKLPHFDQLWSSPRLFERAHAYFKMTGRFVRLNIENPPDVMHWTYPLPIFLNGARNIYTLHDLVPLRLPFGTLDDKRFYRALLDGCIRHADHICTVSEASRIDIEQILSIAPDKISNTYQISSIVDAVLNRNVFEHGTLLESTFGLKPDGYFLFFGAIEPKKNLGRLIEAYLSLETKTPLVIVASGAWQSHAELVLLPMAGDVAGPRHANLENRVIQIDYLPRHLMMTLLRGARALVFPSLYEGFGLPVHEAMQLGVPVLSSNIAAIPEVAGDAAILVDPYDVAAIAEGLLRLDHDGALRTDLAARGRIKAAEFSVEHYQSALTLLYERALKDAG